MNVYSRLPKACKYYSFGTLCFKWVVPEDIDEDSVFRSKFTTETPATTHPSGKLRLPHADAAASSVSVEPTPMEPTPIEAAPGGKITDKGRANGGLEVCWCITGQCGRRIIGGGSLDTVGLLSGFTIMPQIRTDCSQMGQCCHTTWCRQVKEIPEYMVSCTLPIT